ncbi:hypothetical protein ACWCQW_54665 [Streptomyces mirabilis]
MPSSECTALLTFNRAATAVTRVQQVNRALDCSLEIETEQLINDLLSTNDRQAPAQ